MEKRVVKKCCREVLQRGVVEKRRRRVLETIVGHRSTNQKCRQVHSYLIMTGPCENKV